MEKLNDYFLLMKDRPDYFLNNDEQLLIVKDKDIIENYMKKHHVQIGIIYQSPYHMFVVDLVKDKQNHYFTYERLIKKDNGVVMVVKYQNQYLLLKQYRHALRCNQYAFPRGFGEDGISGKENAIKELKEELHASVRSIQELPSMIVDSGICGNKVRVFVVEIESFDCQMNYEGIREIVLLSSQELHQYIKDGLIDDGITLAALTLLENR